MVGVFTPVPVDKSLFSLQKFQDVHDKSFHGDVYGMSNLDQLRHIAFHVTKVAGRLADYFDKLDHGDEVKAGKILDELKDRRIPDLFVFSLMLANRTGLDLEKSYFSRMKSVESESLS